jgi:hypothetical protein
MDWLHAPKKTGKGGARRGESEKSRNHKSRTVGTRLPKLGHVTRMASGANAAIEYATVRF